MALFWLVTAAMAALALAFVLVPLLRTRTAAGPSEAEANLEVLRGHRREIEADIAAGTLPADAREEALEELVGRAATDLDAPARPVAAESRRPWRLAGAIALLVPLLAFGLYRAIGSPQAIEAGKLARTAADLDASQIVAMVESLAAKMKERPDDAKGWALLARSWASLERFQESAEAYAHLAKLEPANAQVLADYADALAMAQGRKLAGRPAELVREALKIDPANQKAHALAATAAMDAGDYDAAIGHWRAIAAQLPADSEDAREVDRIIDEVRERARASGRTITATAPASKAAPRPGAPARGAGASSVSGSIALAPDIAGKLSGTETVFVLARAEGAGRGPPLAVIRASARELPMKFALDDSQAMAPGMNLSSATAVRVEARITRSGEVTPRSGDFVGASAVVKPGARDVAVVVDRVIP